MRVVVEDVLSARDCAELICIQNSAGVVGYRPHVVSATLHDLASTEPALLPIVVAARDKVYSAVEQELGLVLELMVEFTGLISWRAGASIGWHHDANRYALWPVVRSLTADSSFVLSEVPVAYFAAQQNRPYLQQRYVSAVVYLNAAGNDFGGGMFHFKDPAQEVMPRPGRLVAYSSDTKNVHKVDPVTSGERYTMAMWFTMDPAHWEDAVVLPRLTGAVHPCTMPPSFYQLTDGADLRVQRLQQLGLQAMTPELFSANAAAACLTDAVPADGASHAVAVPPGASDQGAATHRLFEFDSLQHLLFAAQFWQHLRPPEKLEAVQNAEHTGVDDKTTLLSGCLLLPHEPLHCSGQHEPKCGGKLHLVVPDEESLERLKAACTAWFVYVERLRDSFPAVLEEWSKYGLLFPCQLL